MSRFDRLLVAVGESATSAAVPYAATLAARTGAALTLADVVTEVPRLVRPLLPRGWNVPALVQEHKQANLERNAARVRRLGVDPDTVLLTGPPVKALAQEVVRGGYDLLATDASRSDALESVGTTAGRLVRECPRPVLLVRRTRRGRRQRVLVALDAGPWRMKGTEALNPAVLEAALWFAGQLGGDLHVLHVWAPYAERFMRRAGLTPAELTRFVSDAREQARQDLEDAIASYRDRIPPSHVHLEKGDPRKEIPSFAAARRFDLLVIGTVGRSGLSGRLIGNTAEAVLARLPCSMLVVRP
jgi:universal stress protein E